MSKQKQRTVRSHSKRAFLRGLAVLLPSILTLWLVVKAYQFVDSAIAEPINRWIRTAFIQIPKHFPSVGESLAMGPTQEELSTAALDAGVSIADTSAMQLLASEMFSESVNSWWASHAWMNLLGLLVAAVIVYISGRLVGGFLGRALYRRLEKIMVAVPVIRKVYPYIKQLVDFLITDSDSPKFSRVVAVEYPRKGIWSVGFITGSPIQTIEKRIPDSVTIFIPSSPTPFTGYTITVQKKDTIELPLSVEEAIRFAVSGGVLIPDHQRLTSQIGTSEDPARMETSTEENENTE